MSHDAATVTLECSGRAHVKSWRVKSLARRAAREAALERAVRTQSHEVAALMAMVQAVMALRHELDEDAYSELRVRTLSAIVEFGYGPAPSVREPNSALTFKPDAQVVFDLLAPMLDENPRPHYKLMNYPGTLGWDPSMFAPGCVFGALISVDEGKIALLAKDLRRLALAHPDDMQTMFTQDLHSVFDRSSPAQLTRAEQVAIHHAGLTLVTVQADVKDAPMDEINERVDIACRCEAWLLLSLARRNELARGTQEHPGLGGIQLDEE